MASPVTGRPSRCAARISSTVPAQEMCWMWRAQPVSRQRAMSRRTASVSASGGMTGRLNFRATGQSRITPPPSSDGTTACCITGLPSAAARRIASRITFSSATKEPSSVNAAAPASASRSRSATSRPSRPFVMQAAGAMRTGSDLSSICSRSHATLSPAGVVFGIVVTHTNPPAAAAAAPVARVSASGTPGSRKCTCTSRNPLNLKYLSIAGNYTTARVRFSQFITG